MDHAAVNNYDEMEISLSDLFYAIYKKIFFIFLTGLLFASLAYLYSKNMIRPIYESTAKLYIINRQTDGVITSADLSSGSQLTKDYKELILSRIVTEQVITDLNLNDTYEQFQKKITVNTPADTRIIEIIIRDVSPGTAKLIADQIAEVSVNKISDVMETEKANIIDYGNIPLNPVSPQILYNTLIGFILGFLISCMLSIVIYLKDDSIKTEEDIEKYLSVSTLSCIPLTAVHQVKRKRNKKSQGGVP